MLLALLLSLSTVFAHAHASDPNLSCMEAMLARESQRSDDLAVGVLVRDVRGHEYLGVGSYLFGSHATLLHKLEIFDLQEILWMGELRYTKTGGEFKIVTANETSGYYLRLTTEGFNSLGTNVIVSNSWTNIPEALRGRDFKGKAFDLKDQHLAPELHGKDKNWRHSVGNIIQAVTSFLRVVQVPEPSLAQVARYRARGQENLQMAKQVLDFGYKRKTFTRDEIPNLAAAVEALNADPVDIAAAKNIDDRALEIEAEKLSKDDFEIIAIPSR